MSVLKHKIAPNNGDTHGNLDDMVMKRSPKYPILFTVEM